jgi:adenylylsulfate kinase
MTLDLPERDGSMQRTASTNRGLAVWVTGLSGAGKPTLCRMLEPQLRDRGYPVLVLDADEIRQGVNGDLGFSKADRDENIRRLGETARLLVQQNFVVLVAAISPYCDAREQVRRQIGSFLEVHVNASLATCMVRDPKGLYARALRGEIRYFTGIDNPYEPPLHPDVECNTDAESCEESVEKVLAAIRHVQQGRLFSALRSSGRLGSRR